MIETYKRQDGEGLGANKIGVGSSENIPEPPETQHKSYFVPKPNHHRNQLDTTPTPPVFLPQPKPKPKLVRFHCDYCGRDDHTGDFCFKRKREERMAKKWANKDKYHPSNGVLEPRVQMPRAKASVRTVSAWGERKAAGGVAGRATPIRLVRHTGQTGAGLGRQGAGFHAHEESRFGSGGRGSGG
jgi:hypothetical protein